MEEKVAYVPMASDFIHHGHLNIINEARKFGKVVVGLLTDKAIAEYKSVPILSWEQRKLIIENIRGVDEVIPQETWDYEPNLRKLRPDYVVHGDDWKEGVQKRVREKVLDVLKEWNGKLVEPTYTRDISSSHIRETLRRVGITPEVRMKRLRRLLRAKSLVSTAIMIACTARTRPTAMFQIRNRPSRHSMDWSIAIVYLLITLHEGYFRLSVSSLVRRDDRNKTAV